MCGLIARCREVHFCANHRRNIVMPTGKLQYWVETSNIASRWSRTSVGEIMSEEAMRLYSWSSQVELQETQHGRS